MSPPDICAAIRRALADAHMTQDALAAAMGESQQTISGWARNREPKLRDIARIEANLGRPRGSLLRTAGCVEELTTTRGAIASDPEISQPHRDLLLGVYELAVSLSSRTPEARPATTQKNSKRSNT